MLKEFYDAAIRIEKSYHLHLGYTMNIWNKVVFVLFKRGAMQDLHILKETTHVINKFAKLYVNSYFQGAYGG